VGIIDFKISDFLIPIFTELLASLIPTVVSVPLQQQRQIQKSCLYGMNSVQTKLT